jgi:hypothetical protein
MHRMLSREFALFINVVRFLSNNGRGIIQAMFQATCIFRRQGVGCGTA